MATIAREHVYVGGQVARASHANDNENKIYNEFNGNIDWDNLKASLVNAADGILKLDASGKVPLAQIPDVLTGKTLNIGATQTLRHNSVEIITTGGKVKHAVYG